MLASVESLEGVEERLGEAVVVGGEGLAQEGTLHAQLSADTLQLIATVTLEPRRRPDQLPGVYCPVAKNI